LSEKQTGQSANREYDRRACISPSQRERNCAAGYGIRQYHTVKETAAAAMSAEKTRLSAATHNATASTIRGDFNARQRMKRITNPVPTLFNVAPSSIALYSSSANGTGYRRSPYRYRRPRNPPTLMIAAVTLPLLSIIDARLTDIGGEPLARASHTGRIVPIWK
jgi:hypothetical protein